MPKESFWTSAKNQTLVFLFDAFAAFISLPLSYMLRYDSYTEPVLYEPLTLKIYALAFALKLVTLNLFSVSKSLWRFTGTRDLLKILTAQFSALVMLVLVLFVVNRVDGLPRSVIFIDLMIGMALMCGARIFYRVVSERQGSSKKEELKSVLLIGAGNAGAQIVRDSVQQRQSGIKVIAVFDDDPKTHGRSIHGVKVVGSTDGIGNYARRTNVTDVIIAIPSASGEQMRKLAKLCSDNGLKAKTLPSLSDIFEGKVEISSLRPINIDDLLARDPVELNLEQVRNFIEGRVVMVTGAGGSIGSELCKQILHYNPAKLILFENCEFFMYRTEMELQRSFRDIEIVPVMGDIRDSGRVEQAFQQHSPHVVFHAAAYKHVPMMEANPHEAIKTNVIGTALLANIASKYNVDRFVMISTDKAVNPTNIMGATKRVAEMVCLEQNNKASTRFSIIRFGNVLGSAGSVIPLFQEQIRSGGPLTITHPEITRYFMSIPEATRLVLQACALGSGGEIFVLEMGKPIKIVDLAKDLIRLSGLEVDKDIQIEFTGLRPGEKLYEELLTDTEHTQATAHNKVRIAKARSNPPSFLNLLDGLISSVNGNEEYKALLKELVPEYQPGKDQGN